MWLPAGCTLRTYFDTNGGETVIGHECRLSRANSGAIIWICQCGQIGDAIPLVGTTEAITARSRRRVELTEAIARTRHGAHLNVVRADIVRRSDEHLTQIGHAVVSSNAILQRRGRWGHP